ncbi:MAG TPA: hypothetical protein VJ771_05630 [Candidatus Nitrosotalea sp.]|nr:hypothetical protein [Candidatus Nitrosotalea sp.]
MVKEKETRREQKNRLGQNSHKYRNKLIALGIVAGIISAFAYVSYDLDAKPNSAAASIDGIECNTNEFSVLHSHAHLDLYVNGNQMTVPERIGVIDNKCLYWMHTHNTSGVMHIESPKSMDFTMGQFINIWKASGDFPVSGAIPKIFVNGQAVNTNLEETKIKEHDEIAIVYGTPPSVVPPYYQFKEGD